MLTRLSVDIFFDIIKSGISGKASISGSILSMSSSVSNVESSVRSSDLDMEANELSEKTDKLSLFISLKR